MRKNDLPRSPVGDAVSQVEEANPHRVVIRNATLADAAALAVLAARTFSDTFASFNKREDMDLYLSAAFGAAQQEREIRDPATATLIAETDGVAAGYVQLHEGPAPACVATLIPIEILRFYVDRAWHGRGIAAALMREALEHSRTRNAQSVWLGVWEHNSRAIAFYRKQGFVDVGSKTFILGSDHQIDRVMILSPLILQAQKERP